MEGVQIIIAYVILVLSYVFLTSFFKAKGKDLATKQDIEEITRKTEAVQKEFKEDFELFSSDLRFKYDFYYKQYCELYSKLYAIIIQSEYVKHFLFLTSGAEHSFEDVPFVEIYYRKTTMLGLTGTENQTTENITTPITECNKTQLFEYIIDNGAYATQKLLKLAVAYRYAHSQYSGNKQSLNTPSTEVGNSEEIRLIREMVCCIVSEYNFFRKELKMDYNKEELDKGIPLLEED